MNYQQIERDFVLRTLALLEQYDNCELKSANQNQSNTNEVLEKYEVTLLINCLLGLLVLPTARLYNRIPLTRVSTLQGWGIDKHTKMRWGIEPNGGATMRYMVRRMRNSISHFNIKVLAEDTEQRQIYAVELRDVDIHNNADTFYMKVSVKELRTFVTKLAETLTSTRTAPLSRLTS